MQKTSRGKNQSSDYQKQVLLLETPPTTPQLMHCIILCVQSKTLFLS